MGDTVTVFVSWLGGILSWFQSPGTTSPTFLNTEHVGPQKKVRPGAYSWSQLSRPYICPLLWRLLRIHPQHRTVVGCFHTLLIATGTCLQDCGTGKSRGGQQRCLLSGSYNSISFHLSLKPGASSALERPAPFSLRCYLFLCFRQDELGWTDDLLWLGVYSFR